MYKTIKLLYLFLFVPPIYVAQTNEDGIVRLKNAYPDYIYKCENGYVILNDGTRIIYDDGKKKKFVEKLTNTDIEDMFACPYIKDNAVVPSYLSDAGRCRNEQLFKKMYGSSATDVSSRLVNVNWFGQKIRFTTINNANKYLEAVRDEIINNSPHLKKYIINATTFYWRNVRGANRLSAHSYGIAIDINVSYSDYWLWKTNGNNDELAEIEYSNRIPLELVEIFERHGFIWGGRWYHFDTMHFEFRPELNPIESF